MAVRPVATAQRVAGRTNSVDRDLAPPNVEPSHVTRRVRARADVHRNSGWRAAASRHRPRTIVLRTGFAVLMCLTTWAVASVSAWMVPLYLALMALIFVTPRNQHQLPVLSKRRANLVSDEEASSDRRLTIVSAGEADILHLADRPVAEAATDESAVDVTGSAPDPVGASPVKQLRGRTRTRKTGKSAAETASVLPPVAWVRVGPGKFVRADSATHPIDQVQPHAQSDLCVAGAKPASRLGRANAACIINGYRASGSGTAELQPAGYDGQQSGRCCCLLTKMYWDRLPKSMVSHPLPPVRPPRFLLHPIRWTMRCLVQLSDQRSTPSRSLLAVGKRQTGIWVSNGPGRQIRGLDHEQGGCCGGLPMRIPGVDQTCRRRTVGYGCKLRTSVWSSIGPSACRNSRARVPGGGLCAFIAH